MGSLTAAFLRLFPTDLTLNIMTLSGMTVAVGRVVDDSIVVLENIYRQIQKGGDRKTAILVGTRDVSIAILASTITTGGCLSAYWSFRRNRGRVLPALRSHSDLRPDRKLPGGGNHRTSTGLRVHP